MHHNKSMYITNVEKEGPFLKIWGQTDKKASLEVEEALLLSAERFDEGKHTLDPHSLEVGKLCCAKYIDEKYYRARISSIALVTDGLVEVYFLDYGNKDIVPILNLRSPECFNPAFISLPPLSSPFILAEVVCIDGEWNDKIIEQISKEIRYIETNYVVVAQAIRYFFIKVFVNDIDLGLHLVRRNLMQHTSLQTQEAVLLAMIPRTQQPVAAPQNQSLLQYKSFTLEPNSRHEVYVSYITDGPCNFSVQLKKYESTLAQLMKEINSIPLTPLEECPIPGTVCLAKCIDDGHICRAVVTNEVDSQYKLFYVDFGNFELVPPENLYKIPFKYVIPKIMAIRLSLIGIEKPSMTFDMQRAFKQFVDNRLLMMEVYPGTKKLSLMKCKMWDPDTDTNVLEVLNAAAKCAYPDMVTLTKGYTQIVKVSYVHSCSRLYLQFKNKEDELSQLMADLQAYCNSSQTPLLDKEIKEGQPCCAIFSGDEQWYRALITKVEGDVVTVRYVDFGNEEDMSIRSIKVIEGEYLTVLRPQAFECCLNGYQKVAEDEEWGRMLEELIFGQEFTMKVIGTINNKTVVDLINTENETVTSLLMESMIAAKKPQAVPAKDNRFDNSGSKYGSRETREDDKNQKAYYQHDDRGSPKQNWKEKSDENTSWRQNTRKRNDSGSSNASWRQDNKGFKNRKDNDWNERPSNDGVFKKDREGFRGKNFNNERPPRTNNRGEWNAQGEGAQNDYSRKKGDDEWVQNDNKKSFNRRDNNDRKEWNNNGSESGDWGAKKGGFRGRNANNDEDWKKNNTEKKDNDGWGQNVNRKKFGGRDNNDDNDASGGDWGAKKGGFRGRNTEGDDWNKGNRERKFEDRNREYKNNDRGDFKGRSSRREGSEFSSSGSEKSFGKGLRTSTRNDTRPPRTDRKFENKKSDNSWNVSSVPSVIDSAPNNATFKTSNVDGRQERVTISWFHNPNSFFCQLVQSQEAFRSLMQNIQEAYKGRPSGSSVVGAPVIGLFPEDNVLYRARVLEVIGSQYKIYYVDFGNVSVVDKVWPIENKFMEMPMQAVSCSLNGIEPISDNWPDPDSFSKYFEHDFLDCHFISSENGSYWVNISCDNRDIGEQLVNDGFAKLSGPTTIDFNIELFIEQQFRAMLKSMENSSNFCLLLQSGITLNCCMHNLANATEINEDELKQYIDQILIVFANNLVEERLEVTLYDSCGNKLNILSPDEGAYDNVEILCPYLVTKSVIYGLVSHVNETKIIIQPTECAQNLECLVEQLYDYYEKLPPEDPLIPEEGFVYAVKSEDGNWYRGRVNSFDDEKATVDYLDYGNSEEIPFSSLRELTSDFMQWDIMAISVNIKTPASDLLDQEVTCVIYYGETGWEGEVQVAEATNANEELNETQSHSEPSLLFTETSTEIPPETNELCVPPSETAEAVAIEESASKGIENEISSKGTLVILSHVDSPSDFYIQLSDSIGALKELQLNLQNKVEDMVPLESASVGGLCAAPYSLDQSWYRSQILDADDDITTVRFIDFGNTDVIDNKTTQIKTLPPELLSLEEYATRCRLKIKPLEEEWSKQATDRFEKLTFVDNVTVEFINQDDKTNYVEIYSNGENVKEIMIKENLAALDGIVLETELTGFVSHINSPSEFWVQLESCCDELEWIAEQLSNADSFVDLEDLTPGSLCAAMFPDDEMWYRARILSNTVAGLEVLFLDYGNSCVCSNLKQLPEHLVMASPLAQKCSLSKPEGLVNWSTEASKKFAEISADGHTIFTVKKLTTGETSVVELLTNGENVLNKLTPITDNGYVTDIESLENFSISKDSTVSEEKFKLEKLSGCEYDEESLKKFIEISDEGKTCFDVEYLPDNTVRLYLNGTDVRLKFSTISSEEKTPQHKVPLEKSNTLPENHIDTSGTESMVQSLITEMVADVYSAKYSENELLSRVNPNNEPEETSDNLGGVEAPSLTNAANEKDENSVHNDLEIPNVSMKTENEVQKMENDDVAVAKQRDNEITSTNDSEKLGTINPSSEIQHEVSVHVIEKREPIDEEDHDETGSAVDNNVRDNMITKGNEKDTLAHVETSFGLDSEENSITDNNEGDNMNNKDDKKDKLDLFETDGKNDEVHKMGNDDVVVEKQKGNEISSKNGSEQLGSVISEPEIEHQVAVDAIEKQEPIEDDGSFGLTVDRNANDNTIIEGDEKDALHLVETGLESKKSSTVGNESNNMIVKGDEIDTLDQVETGFGLESEISSIVTKDEINTIINKGDDILHSTIPESIQTSLDQEDEMVINEEISGTTTITQTSNDISKIEKAAVNSPIKSDEFSGNKNSAEIHSNGANEMDSSKESESCETEVKPHIEILEIKGNIEQEVTQVETEPTNVKIEHFKEETNSDDGVVKVEILENNINNVSNKFNNKPEEAISNTKPSSLEFKENILASFSSPTTVENKELPPKLSPPKVSPKANKSFNSSDDLN